MCEIWGDFLVRPENLGAHRRSHAPDHARRFPCGPTYCGVPEKSFGILLEPLASPFKRFWASKKVQKDSHFLKTHSFQLFQASKPFPSSSPCPKVTLQCPSQFLGPSGRFVLSDFFLWQKFHFWKFWLICYFSALSDPRTISSVFSGTPQYVWPR